VLAEDRPSFEKDHNETIRYILPNGTLEVCPYNSTEYAPVLYETQDEHLYLVDIASYPILQMALFSARDSGVFTLSPPSLFLGSWQMGAYLAYYGQIDPTTLTSNSQRMQACQGYVATALNITDVFGVALSRFNQLLSLSLSLSLSILPLFAQEFLCPQNRLFNRQKTKGSLHSQV
jgi:hypothetical protein